MAIKLREIQQQATRGLDSQCSSSLGRRVASDECPDKAQSSSTASLGVLMPHSSQTWRDLFLLLSLLLVILLYPFLDRGEVRRLVLGGLMFAPLLFATVRMAQIKALVFPTILLVGA